VTTDPDENVCAMYVCWVCQRVYRNKFHLNALEDWL
jgi:hypothetical protein